jgi:WD40 repeat protein
MRKLVFSPDGTMLAVIYGHQAETLALFDVRTRTELTVVEIEAAWYLQDIAFSPNGDLLATEDDDGTVYLWGVPAA